MASLIDEALADEKAFREKTAQMLAIAGCFASADNVRRGRSVLRTAVIVLQRRVHGIRRGDGQMSDARTLAHVEALDAATWAKEQLGR